MTLKSLFKDEVTIAKDVREIAAQIVELSEFAEAKSPLELAHAEVVGKRIREACDRVNDEVHHARRQVGALLSEQESIVVRDTERALNDVFDELSVVHGSVEAIGRIAEGFFEARDREVAYRNLNRVYERLVRQVSVLLSSKQKLSAML